MRRATRRGLLAAAALLACAVTPVIAQSPASSFGWFAELVSFDAATKRMKVKAALEPHVAKFAANFVAGEPVVLVWTQFNGEADAVRYIAAANAMTAETGYLVRGKIVRADAAARTLTFTTQVSDSAAKVLSSARPGTPVRVAAPLVASASSPAVTTLALGKTAPPRPAPVVKAAPAGNARPVAGTWALATALQGNPVTLECAWTQDSNKIGGDCKGPGPLGSMPVTGTIEGDEVKFQFSISGLAPVAISVLHTGKLDAAGTTVAGTMDFMGSASPFKATRK